VIGEVFEGEALVVRGVGIVCVRGIGGRGEMVRGIGGRGEMVCGSVFERGGLFERVRLLRGGVDTSEGSDVIESGGVVVVVGDGWVFFGGMVGLKSGGLWVDSFLLDEFLDDFGVVIAEIDGEGRVEEGVCIGLGVWRVCVCFGWFFFHGRVPRQEWDIAVWA